MKQHKPDPGQQPKSSGRSPSGLTQPGDLYVQGDALPVPDVVEKDTDSVWALWSDMVEQEAVKEAEPDRDFKETVPLDLDALEPTQLMGLPEVPRDDGEAR